MSEYKVKQIQPNHADHIYGYIYKTTNLINGKIYVGQHKAHTFTDTYKGSGKYLHHAIKYYGIENFSVELLENAHSKTELNLLEIKWIERLNSRDRSIGYNFTAGGTGGDTFSNQTDENKKIIKDRRSKSLQGHITSDETKKKISLSEKGKYVSDETRKKISEKCKGNPSWLKGKHLSEEIRKHLSEKCSGWHHTQEAKDKISKSSKGKPHSEEWKMHQRHPHKRRNSND